jgi:hypothetical protein
VAGTTVSRARKKTKKVLDGPSDNPQRVYNKVLHFIELQAVKKDENSS